MLRVVEHVSLHVKPNDATGDQLPLMTVPSNFSLSGAQRASFGKIMLARQWCMPPKSQTRGSSTLGFDWNTMFTLEHCLCWRETQKKRGREKRGNAARAILELFSCSSLNISTVFLSFAFSLLILPVPLSLHSVVCSLVCTVSDPSAPYLKNAWNFGRPWG